jgi:hypothetical protein
MACSTTPAIECPVPASQGIVTSWGSSSLSYPLDPQSMTQGQFVYNGGTGTNQEHDNRVLFEGGKVILRPSCTYLPDPNDLSTYRLELRNMCPSLRSGGVDCRSTNPPRCSFEADTCPATSGSAFNSTSNATGRCVYDEDLIRTTADASYLIRSTAPKGIAQIPAAASGRLLDNFAERLGGTMGLRVTSGSKADAWCIGVKNRTLRGMQGGETDFRAARDSFSRDYGPVYWGQLAWVARILSARTDDVNGTGQACNVTQNCNCASEWGTMQM